MGTGAIGGGGTTGLANGVQIASPGIITRVNLNTDKTFQPLGQLFWSVHLALGPDEDDGIIQTFVQGYIQWPSSLTWTGFLELHEQQWIIIRAVGLLNQVGTMSDARLTLTRDGILGAFMVKLLQKGKS